MRFLSLIVVCISVVVASGCGSSWNVAGDPLATLSFGTAPDLGSEEIWPMADALYTGQHPIRIGVHAQDVYRDASGAALPGPNTDVNLSVSLINLDTNQFWDGRGWHERGVIIELVQNQLMDCGLATRANQEYLSCFLELQPAQLGDARCKVSAHAWNPEGGPVSAVEREFRVDVDGEPIFDVQRVLPNPSGLVARLEGKAASGLRRSRVHFVDRGTGTLLADQRGDRDIQDALSWNASSETFGSRSDPALFLQSVGPDDEPWEFDVTNDQAGSGLYGVVYDYVYLDLYQESELRFDTSVEVRVSEIAPTVAYTYDLSPTSHSTVDISSSDDRGVELIELSLRHPSSDVSWDSQGVAWVRGEYWNRVYLFAGGGLAERDVTQPYRDRIQWIEDVEDNDYELSVRSTDFTGAFSTRAVEVDPFRSNQGSRP